MQEIFNSRHLQSVLDTNPVKDRQDLLLPPYIPTFPEVPPHREPGLPFFHSQKARRLGDEARAS